MVFHTNPLIFELSFNLSLTHLRAQIVCYELKVDLSPLMLKEIFHNSFENFETTRICMENHTNAQKNLIQMLPALDGGFCNQVYF